MSDPPMPSAASSPLDGIVVLSFEQAVAAPLATRHLADLGARVVKVERPETGDFARAYDRTVSGEASYFVWLNRGKESLEADLRAPADRALLDAIVEEADVVVQNLRPGAAARAGVDDRTIRRRRPAVVHCSISGYGDSGPYQDRKAYDLLVQCEAGLLAASGTPDVPCKAGISVADIAAGMYAFSDILAALFRRERTGEGATLHVAMIDALAEWMTQPVYFGLGGRPVPRTGARHASIAPYGPYAVKDGVVFLGVQNDREWARLCEGLGRAELASDPRFLHNPERLANDAEITKLIESAFAPLGADEVVGMLHDAGIACARMREPADLLSHPQLTSRLRWRDVALPGGDTVPGLLPPLGFVDWVPALRAVPALGSHNLSLRAEFGSGRPDGGGRS